MKGPFRGNKYTKEAGSLIATVFVLIMGFVFCFGLIVIFSPKPNIHMQYFLATYFSIILLIYMLRATKEATTSDLDLIEKIHGKKLVAKEHKYQFGKKIKHPSSREAKPPTAEDIKEIKEGNVGNWGIVKVNDSSEEDEPEKLV